MSKDITWFKFYPSEWMMGRIQRQPENVQLAFIRLICKYWHKECVLTIEEAELDCGESETGALLNAKIILSNDGLIEIKFLNEQMVEIQSISDKNRENAHKRWNKTPKGANATALRPHTTDIQTDADKIREDKIKEYIGVFNDMFGTKYQLTDKVRGHLGARIKEGYKIEDFKTAMMNLHNSDHHKKSGYKWATPEFILRPDNFQKFLNAKPTPKHSSIV